MYEASGGIGVKTTKKHANQFATAERLIQIGKEMKRMSQHETEIMDAQLD